MLTSGGLAAIGLHTVGGAGAVRWDLESMCVARMSPWRCRILADQVSTKVIKGVSYTSLEGAKALVAAGAAKQSDFWVCVGGVTRADVLLLLCAAGCHPGGGLPQNLRDAEAARALPPLYTNAQKKKALGHLLELLEVEAASLAPGGDGLTAHARLITKRRALHGVLVQLSDLAADDNTKNDPATFAALSAAAQHAVTTIHEARATRQHTRTFTPTCHRPNFSLSTCSAAS